MKTKHTSEYRYPVVGAGSVVISIAKHGMRGTGTARGVSVGVTWGKYGEAGGVMDISVVRSLVNDLSKWLKERDE